MVPFFCILRADGDYIGNKQQYLLHLSFLPPYPWQFGSFEWITQLIDVSSSPCHTVLFYETPEPLLWSQSLKAHQIPAQSQFPNVQFNTLDCTSNFPLEIKGKTDLFIKVSFWHSVIFNCSTHAPVAASNSVWEGWGSQKIPQQAGSTAAAELQMCCCELDWLQIGEQGGWDWEGIFCWVLWKWKMDIMDIKGWHEIMEWEWMLS